jgi:hypothetical protein
VSSQHARSEGQWLLLAALQKLIAKVSALADTIASLAERVVTKELVATNGTFDQVNTNRLCVKKSDGTPVCVTGDQLSALLSQSAAVGFANPSPANTSTPTDNQLENPAPGGATTTDPATPPVISISGNNPAHINVGDAYSDLGARIIGPTEADTNLGLRYFVDGALVPFVSLDTSTSTTYVIEYVAENATGTSTSTRTVIVQAHEQMTFAQPTPPPPEEATSSAATSTSATTTPQ